ncbi:YihY/virulence factor BrkB family protein [Thiohalocapsa marina]|uniref:YihY/virulence factor BrkB family protein n=1 Tax=Thiohalocapsa marina TaxID=424902 RepID=A0A5M8FLD6_9GAMM|nr:YihY/virulence factor BrkB family protein [Thiohalocapsa marina]KAA6184810.1 YihY/virulence factor BrkB family protein [Thiohalocapsa marina]
MDQEKQLTARLTRWLWQTDPNTLPAMRRRLLLIGRMLYAIGRDIARGQMTLQAMSLVYTTLLSLVPLLAVSFSVLKGFGVHNQVEPLLKQALEPLGQQGKEISATLIGYVDNISVGVLGSVGLAMLLYSVISLISKIEQVFNHAWRIEQRRPLSQRFSQYLSVLLVGPVLFFSAVGATASLRNLELVQRLLEVQALGLLVEHLGRALPYLLISLTFTFVYAFVPYTRVRPMSALIGGLVAGFLWQTIGYVFAAFMAGSTRYAAIYSSLAIPILFMIWIYIAWLILLIGANISFYYQNPEYLLSRTRTPRLSNRLRERTALAVATRIAQNHDAGQPPLRAEALAHDLAIPLSNVQQVLGLLQQGQLLVATAGDPPGYVPARAVDRIRLQDLLQQIRRADEDRLTTPQACPCPTVDALEQRLDDALAQALSGLTLRDLAPQRAETSDGISGDSKISGLSGSGTSGGNTSSGNEAADPPAPRSVQQPAHGTK